MKHNWIFVGHDAACDTNAGEVSLDQSPAQLASLDACQRSCVADSECRSITYSNTGSCTRFSTPCSQTKQSANAISLRIAAAPDSTSAPIPPQSTGQCGPRLVSGLAHGTTGIGFKP